MSPIAKTPSTKPHNLNNTAKYLKCFQPSPPTNYHKPSKLSKIITTQKNILHISSTMFTAATNWTSLQFTLNSEINTTPI